MTIKVMSFSMHWQSVAEEDITADQESRANFSHRCYTHQHLSLARMHLKIDWNDNSNNDRGYVKNCNWFCESVHVEREINSSRFSRLSVAHYPSKCKHLNLLVHMQQQRLKTNKQTTCALMKNWNWSPAVLRLYVTAGVVQCYLNYSRIHPGGI